MMDLIHRICKCDNSHHIERCCFNPTIYFVCKLCRGAFENVEKLLLHKRQEHTVTELKGIKFIIFEERFVETNEHDNCVWNALNSTEAELKCEIPSDTTNTNTTDVNPSPSLNEVDSSDINNVINIAYESEDFKLPNPYVHLRRLTPTEINTAATIQNQQIEEPQISQHHLLSANVCNTTLRTELTTDFEAQEIADGEFIVASVVQSSDGTGNVQFLSTDTCIPAPILTPQNTAITLNVDLEEPVNNTDTISDDYAMEIDSFKKETESGSAGDDDLPSLVLLRIPSPTQLELDKDQGPESCYTNEAELSVQINPVTILVVTETDTQPQLQISTSSTSSTTGRKLRKRPNINYSESQTCTKCSREFCTVQNLEAHEKFCLRNKYKGEQFCKGDLLPITIDAEEEGTPGGIEDYTEVIQTTASFPNDPDLDLDLEVTVIDTQSANDDDFDYADIDISSSESDECDKKVGDEDRISNNDGTEAVKVSQTNVSSIDDPEKNANNTCFTSFKEWRKKQREADRLLKKTPDLSLKCTICGKELATKQGFKLHMEIHEKPNLKDFICETCGSGFRIFYHLQRHMLSHSEDRPFKCKLCPLAFKNKDVLRNHQIVHVKDTNYHCLPCNKSFKSKHLLRKHSVQHLQDKWLPCKAQNCDLKFSSIMKVWRHCKKYHSELFSQLAKFSCSVCNEKFMFNSQLGRHMFSHGGEREKRYRCSEEGCNGSFTSKQSLEEHCRKHTGERPYQCDKCGTTFARQCLFLIHLKAHNNPKDRVLCHLCPRTFSRNWELQQHLTFHEKGRQFKCDKCDLKFMSKANLKGHMKTHERKGAIDDVSSSSSSESEVESEEVTTEESEPESEHVKSST